MMNYYVYNGVVHEDTQLYSLENQIKDKLALVPGAKLEPTPEGEGVENKDQVKLKPHASEKVSGESSTGDIAVEDNTADFTN